MAESYRIVIATGGTGGHLFPAIQLAKELADHRHEIFFLGSFGACIEQLIGTGFRFENLYAKGLKLGSVGGFLNSSFLMTKAIFRSLKFLNEFKPHAVIGFGGYGAFPVVFSAILLRIPSMIHEQNVIPGRANKLLAKMVKKVAISFEDSRKFFNREDIVLTGYPLNIKDSHLSQSEIYHEFKLKEGVKTIFVFGGSQGSHAINTVFLKTVSRLKNEGLLFQVIHACGEKDYLWLKDEYVKLNISYFLSPFINQMAEAYKIVDLVVARSGAGTVTELGLFKVPSILIPYPYAGGHQKENALVLVNAGLARMIEEAALDEMILGEQIKQLLWNEPQKKVFQDHLIFPTDSVRRLAQESVALIK